eukprot:5630782-Alexandrium_andersonii.AAC.1
MPPADTQLSMGGEWSGLQNACGDASVLSGELIQSNATRQARCKWPCQLSGELVNVWHKSCLVELVAFQVNSKIATQ